MKDKLLAGRVLPLVFVLGVGGGGMVVPPEKTKCGTPEVDVGDSVGQGQMAVSDVVETVGTGDKEHGGEDGVELGKGQDGS